MNREMIKKINDEEEINVVIFVEAFWKRIKKYCIWGIILACLLGALLGGYRLRRAVNHEATATINIEITNFENTIMGGVKEDYVYHSNIFIQLNRSAPGLLQSDVLKSAVAKNLNVENINDANIIAELINGTNMFIVRVQCPDREKTLTVLNSVIETCPEYLTAMLQDVNVTVVSAPVLLPEPSSTSSVILYAAIGFAGGLIIAFAVILLITAFDKTVRNEQYVSLFDKKLIGSISNDKKSKYMIDDQKVDNRYCESIRSLRTRVLSEIDDEKGKSIIIAGTSSGEGTSSIAANFALSLAQCGNKVAVLDFDKRKKVTKLFNIKGTKSFDLSGDKNISEKDLSKYKDSSLYLLSIDKFSYGSAEKLISDFKGKFDYVIISAAPISEYSDVENIANYTDYAVYVIRKDYEKIRNVSDDIENLELTKSKILGCIMNK